MGEPFTPGDPPVESRKRVEEIVAPPISPPPGGEGPGVGGCCKSQHNQFTPPGAPCDLPLRAKIAAQRSLHLGEGKYML